MSAMMAGHLTIAGVAEMIVTGGVVAYLQRTQPGLLCATVPEIADAPHGRVPVSVHSTRPLWIGLGLLMLLTPLGVLAAGKAWGEWSASDFADSRMRLEIAEVSGHEAPPQDAPAGLRRLSSFWTAPMPDYAPPYLKSDAFGYVMSAMAGTGLVILATLFVTRVAGSTGSRS